MNRATNKADPRAAIKAEEMWKCYELRLRGLSLRAIAKLVGKSHESVRGLLDTANQSIILPGVEEYRKVEDERLDLMWKSLLPKIEAGDTRSIEQGIRLLERRAKLHGLDRPSEHSVTVHEIDERDRELAEMTREYMLRRHADGSSAA